MLTSPCLGAQADRLRVGRTKKCDVHIKGDISVSEKHAVISWSGKRWEIVDEGSTNGTLLNGAELEEKGEPVRLADGDTLVIGAETTATVKVCRKRWKIPKNSKNNK